MSDLATQPARPQVRWPERFLPGRTQVYMQNEIVIPARARTVWAWLIRAELWPTWYRNAARIHFTSHAGPDLRNRSRFRWRTFGVDITSKVLEFEPCERLAWEAQGIGVEAYHGWVLTEQSDGSTHVLTEETQTGWLPTLGKFLIPARMKIYHRRWLEGLSRQAQTGMPPEPEPFR